MFEFFMKIFPYYLGTQAGLALIRKYFGRININAMVGLPIRLGATSNNNILKIYLTLLFQRKTDFEAIESYRDGYCDEDTFFTRVIGVNVRPTHG